MVRIQREIIAVGAFSMYESLLQSELEWSRPFDELRDRLEEQEHHDLSSRFEDYRLAINVLKHGTGLSHTRLLERREELEFAIKEPSTFFYEGDITEGQSLIDVDEKFVQRCAELIKETRNKIDK
ncbi:hypothetical protein ACFOW6_15910 [Fodinicurvata halophila]|uniref:Uncharacterized protein n=1 Tax=Fodinicurvata halophila TaxID=1419723 RepID=A0ABV8UR95_9PROT